MSLGAVVTGWCAASLPRFSLRGRFLRVSTKLWRQSLLVVDVDYFTLFAPPACETVLLFFRCTDAHGIGRATAASTPLALSC